MLAPLIPKLASLLDAYFEEQEFIDMAGLFDVRFPAEHGRAPESREQWLSFACQIFEGLEQGSNRALLTSILEQLETRNATAIATTTWERRDANEALRPLIRDLTDAVSKLGAPAEITAPAGKGFTAKSHVRDLLEQAKVGILVVDPYVGVATLDCFRTVSVPVRLLTAVGGTAVEKGFEAALLDFQGEGRQIHVRRAAKLHDRHLVFNDRCWLIGSSLKDAGTKAFHCIEIVDAKQQVIADLEARWSTGARFP